MNDMEAYGDGYMAPEEEWEREGLLDPAWEKQQKKVSEVLSEGSKIFFFFFLSYFEHDRRFEICKARGLSYKTLLHSRC